MNRRTVSNEDRLRMIRAVVDQGMTYADTATILGHHVSTVKGVLAKFYRTGMAHDERVNNYREKKLDTGERVMLCLGVMENPTVTQRELQQHLEEDFDVTVSQSTVSRTFKEESITRKILFEVPYDRNSPAVLQARRNFGEWLMGLIGAVDNAALLQVYDGRVIYSDECGFNVNIHRSQGWSFRGNRAFISTAANRGGNVSTFGALSPTRGLWLSTKYGAFNHSSFLSELQCYLDSRIGDVPELGFIFLLDNVPFHHHHVIREFLEGNGHTLVFLPPYSPFLNAIELSFSKIKAAVARKLASVNRRLVSLSELIAECESEVTLNDCLSFHRHTLNYIPRCLNLTPINQ
jgi:transposase